MLYVVLLLQLAAAPAQPPAAEAQRLVRASINDYQLGFFEQALHEAEDAYRLAPLPQILFNIGQCHRALKHWDRAVFFYERYLKLLPDAPNRVQATDLLTEVTYRQKAAELPEPKPRPAPVAAPTPVVVVTAAPAPAPPAPEVVPTAALEAAPEPTRSHTSAWVVGSVAVVCLAVAVVGIVEVESYESLRGQLAKPVSYTQWEKDEVTAKSEGPAASTWEATAIGTGAAALVAGTASVFLW